MVLQNDLLLRALHQESVPRPPVWLMRQAGRYLPEYRKLREKYSFFERCQNPDLATEITLQPVDILGVDAAILFSDILVVPQAMGLEVNLVENAGPVLPAPIRSEDDLKRIDLPDVAERLHYVFEAIASAKKALGGRVPLIGFAGAPWTIFCYMIQSKGSKTFDEARAFLYRRPELSHRLLEMITRVTIDYLRHQVLAGADCIQLFDSWSGILSPDAFHDVSLRYNKEIMEAMEGLCPTILFAKGAWHGLSDMSRLPVNALGIDWCIRPETARQMAGDNITLQGNMDPARLLDGIPSIKNEVQKMVTSFGSKKYIANLGHGMLPHVPVDHVRAFVEEIKSGNW